MSGTNSIPTKSQRSRYWFLRITKEKEYLRQKCGELLGSIDVATLLGVYHTGKNTEENPHVHILIEFHIGYFPQKETVNKRMKALFDASGNKEISLKIWDGNSEDEGAATYVFHEDPENTDILCNKGYSDEKLAKLSTICKKVKEVVAVNKEKASNKLVDKALSHFKNVGGCITKLDILTFMMKCIWKGESYHPGYRLRTFVEEVEIKLSKSEEDVDILANNYYSLLWRN